jgi:putative hydrolase of the HAD superfamily
VTDFDAVLFDLDGTLCRRTQDTERLYRRAFERTDVEPFGEPGDLWQALDGPPDHDDRVGYLGAGFARVAAQYGRSDVDPLALAAAFTDLVDDSQVELRPGADAALDSVPPASIGLVTNGPARRQEVKLDALGIADRFDTAVYAFDLARRKPHSLPFERAVSALGVDPGATLHVGDSLRYDVAGAQNAGITAAWIDDEGEAETYTPDYVLSSLDDLPDVLGGDR